MMTIRKSAARELREHFDALGFRLGPTHRHRSGPEILGWTGIATGQRVCRKDDPRHVGRLDGWNEKLEATVTWDGHNRLTERDIPLGDLEKTK